MGPKKSYKISHHALICRIRSVLPNVLVSNQCDHARWTVSVKGVQSHVTRNLRKKKYLRKGKGEPTEKIKGIRRRELLSI